MLRIKGTAALLHSDRTPLFPLTDFLLCGGYNEGMDIIYADEIFLRNLLADYFLLLLAARLRSAPLHRGRFAAAAGIGGIYAVLAALPPLRFLDGAAGKLACSLLMALIAYGNAAGLRRAWLTFLALSAAFGGAVFALELLFGAGAMSFRGLLLSFGLSYAAAELLFRPLLQRREQRLYPVTVTLGEKSAALTALRDTGNELRDPLSGAPVLLAEASALAPLFSSENASLLAQRDAAALLRALSEVPELRKRVRLIPYRTVGGGGLLAAFRPDTVTAAGEARDVWVAVSPDPLGRGEYNAIL